MNNRENAILDYLERCRYAATEAEDESALTRLNRAIAFFLSSAPVNPPHGTWIIDDNYRHCCSVCKMSIPHWGSGPLHHEWRSPYCPNCGAKMNNGGGVW